MREPEPPEASSIGGGSPGSRGVPAPDAPRGFVRTAGDAPVPQRADSGSWPGGLAPVPGIGPSSDSPVPFRSVGFMISSTGYAIARRFREILAPLELEPREFSLLRAVGHSEGQSQQAIGDRLQIPASRMVAFVDALEERGLLERRQNREDRRARALHLTDDGRRLLDRAFALAVGHERDLCAGLNVDERDQLLELLGRVGLRLGVPPGIGHAALADE